MSKVQLPPTTLKSQDPLTDKQLRAAANPVAKALGMGKFQDIGGADGMERVNYAKGRVELPEFGTPTVEAAEFNPDSFTDSARLDGGVVSAAMSNKLGTFQSEKDVTDDQSVFQFAHGSITEDFDPKREQPPVVTVNSGDAKA